MKVMLIAVLPLFAFAVTLSGESLSSFGKSQFTMPDGSAQKQETLAHGNGKGCHEDGSGGYHCH